MGQKKHVHIAIHKQEGIFSGQNTTTRSSSIKCSLDNRIRVFYLQVKDALDFSTP